MLNSILVMTMFMVRAFGADDGAGSVISSSSLPASMAYTEIGADVPVTQKQDFFVRNKFLEEDALDSKSFWLDRDPQNLKTAEGLVNDLPLVRDTSEGVTIRLYSKQSHGVYRELTSDQVLRLTHLLIHDQKSKIKLGGTILAPQIKLTANKFKYILTIEIGDQLYTITYPQNKLDPFAEILMLRQLIATLINKLPEGITVNGQNNPTLKQFDREFLETGNTWLYSYHYAPESGKWWYNFGTGDVAAVTNRKEYSNQGKPYGAVSDLVAYQLCEVIARQDPGGGSAQKFLPVVYYAFLGPVTWHDGSLANAAKFLNLSREEWEEY